MKLSLAERWILYTQYQILERLDPENASSHRRAQEVVAEGYEAEYAHCAQFMAPDGFGVDDCQEVVEIALLFESLQDSYDRLEDKGGLVDEDVVFPGFDGNSEAGHLNYLHFLRSDRRFRHVRSGGDNLNSHVPMLRRYREMLEAKKRLGKRFLAAAEIREVIGASQPDA